MFERLAAAIVRHSGGYTFAAALPPAMDSVWAPEWQPAQSRTVLAVCDDLVCYRRSDGLVRSVKLASWHRWRRLVRAHLKVAE